MDAMHSSTTPAEVFPPGEFIRDELEARGWTQQDLAQIIQRPLVAVNQIITGKRSITPETAKNLAAAFGTSAEFWLNLESAYQLAHAKINENDVAMRAKLYSLAPIADMVRRGWIQPSTDVDALANELKRFFETDGLDKIDLRVAARKSTSYDDLTPAQRAWCARARHLSRLLKANRYDQRKLETLIPLLRQMTQSVENIRQLPRVLASVGVRLVIVAHLEKTKIDGAAFWVDGNPAVALSLRFDRIDNFWYTLVHELIHIKNRDADVVDSEMESDDDGEGVDEVERRTNAEASEVLVPRAKLDSFITRVRPLYARVKIVQFAHAIGVHPGIVLGQLHYRKEVPQQNLRDLLQQGKVRCNIIDQTITDGWGHQPGRF